MPLARITVSVLCVFASLLANELAASEQAATANPAAGDPQAIRGGTAIFRINCSSGHGPNATGGTRGPSLAANRWTHGSSDDTLFKTITQGVAGTEMPANDLEDEEVR